MGNLGILKQFSGARIGATGDLRDFPLQVSGYDLNSDPAVIIGRDLSSENNPEVRVWLREMRQGSQPQDSNQTRPEVFDFGNDPYAKLTDDQRNNNAHIQAIKVTNNGKCYTKPGGILLVQGAYKDKDGLISANWINKVAGDADEVREGRTVVLAPILARMTIPVSNNRHHFAEVLYPEQKVVVTSQLEFDSQLMNLLASNANGAPSTPIVAINLVDRETGEYAANMTERRKVRQGTTANTVWVDENPQVSLKRFWDSFAPEVQTNIRGAFDRGELFAYLIPGVRYRFIGRSLEALAKEVNRRPGQRWETFLLGDNSNTGWMQCSVILRRHSNSAAGADEEYFPTGVWPVSANEKSQSLENAAI